MVRIEKMSRLHPYAGVELFSMKILGLRPYLHDFLTRKGRALISNKSMVQLEKDVRATPLRWCVELFFYEDIKATPLFA
ncbi:MAG: hypothetical protein IPO37_00540 [Saprospiraceae bacterium]|nr:hypothetical protein [Saprospiraceae bacterium]